MAEYASGSETPTPSLTYFLSHSSGDDAIVRQMRIAPAELDTSLTIESRAFHGGDPLESTIRDAIASSSGVLVLVSPRAHQASWVGKELKHALAVQRQRGGADAFPVVPLLLDGTPLGAFEALFDEAPIHVTIASTAPDAAPHALLVALRRRLPIDAAPQPQPPAEAVEELLLKLSDPRVVTHAVGRRRACARARLLHVPATPGQREVHSARFALEAPLGVIEADELRWYLEDYALWPSPLLAERAQRIEEQLAAWGWSLYGAALPMLPTAEVLKSWAALGGSCGTGGLGCAGKRRLARRFSVEVDSASDAGTPEEQVLLAREAATLLLGLPWELLHDGRGYLFQGGEPVRVRRRLPSEQPVPVAVLATPIRVLLASPRPEDDACSYIDLRASAGPLVDAMEALAGQVEVHLLTPPTLPALRDELDRAKRAGQPYHVLHFDGHGVYDRHAGLGALCFEDPEDVRPRGRRRHANVPSPELGALLREYGIALVFLEACQSAQAESANESVASALLKTGVGWVVAMSHSVLVETSRRFVESFYRALSQGQRVGSAMLAGQRELQDNPVRGRVFGVGEFRLQDWFVPVLYQDRDDPPLFREMPSPQTSEDWRARLRKRLGKLPEPPAHGFVGRSRELLAFERLLAGERYAVVRGQGGEGKTALASEFARWRVRARQVACATFVSLETHGHAPAVLDALGRQLLGQGYSVAAHASFDAALAEVERPLREQPTLLVLDNLESVLAPPFALDRGNGSHGATAEDGASTPSDAGEDSALASDERERADEILRLAARLLACGETRVVFTSREALPVPFAGATQCLELERLSRADAVQLVERALGLDVAGMGHAAEAQRAEIESLVDAVHGHARTLALLAPALRERGPAATQAALVELIEAMERRFPGQREHSLLASAELSLRRLPPGLRERAPVLGVFHGAVDLDMLRHMTGWEAAEVQALGQALVATGLARGEAYNHLSLNPALCPYLAAQLVPAARAALAEQWTEAMRQYAEFLRREQSKNSEMAAALTLMELPNLMALLERVEHAGDPEATIDLTTTLHTLLQYLNRPRLLARVAQARDAASRSLGEAAWGQAQFRAEAMRVEQLLAAGRVGEALTAAQRLHERAQAAGEAVYADADYDLATAFILLGRMLFRAGQAGTALPLLADAQRRFTTVEARAPGCGAAHMVTRCIGERADCLRDLGRLDEAVQAYEQAIALAEQRHNEREVAVGKGQLGTVRLLQRRFPEALAAHTEARERFAALGEAASVAVAWHQIGLVHHYAGNGEAAEDAYREALAIEVLCNNVAGQAGTLTQLGLLYADVLGRPGRRHALSPGGRERRRVAQRSQRRPRAQQPRQHAAPPRPSAGSAPRDRTRDRVYARARPRRHAVDSLGHPRQDRERRRPCQRSAPGEPAGARGLPRLAPRRRREPHARRAPGGRNRRPAARRRPRQRRRGARATGQRRAALAETPGLNYDDAAEILLLLDRLTAAGR